MRESSWEKVNYRGRSEVPWDDFIEYSYHDPVVTPWRFPHLSPFPSPLPPLLHPTVMAPSSPVHMLPTTATASTSRSADSQ
eukprot:scaffold106413_cov24-Tisochrysis_lutea.AAC.1